MFEKIRNLKNKKGFTLVELIVVLVILAILAALLVPALTGYIDKARNESLIAETRSVVIAAQTIVSEDYGQNSASISGTDYTTSIVDEVKTLAEVKGTISNIEIYTAADPNDKSIVVGKIKSLQYQRNDGGKTCYSTRAMAPILIKFPNTCTV